MVTAADRFPADIGVRDGRIVALGDALDRGAEELDASGKLVHGPNPPFNRITNGLPGIEARMPMLLSGAVSTGRMDIHRFVALTSTNAAKLYGLYPRKGTIAIGSDADLAIWDPEREVTMSVDILHDEMDYTPYEGTKVTGWPVVTLLRGATICFTAPCVAARCASSRASTRP